MAQVKIAQNPSNPTEYSALFPVSPHVVEERIKPGMSVMLGSEDYVVTSIKGQFDNQTCKVIRIEAENVADRSQQIFIEFELHQPVFRDGKMSPQWEILRDTYVAGMMDAETAGAPFNVDFIYANAVGEVREGWDAAKFKTIREKVSACSRLLADAFAFPDRETATLFMSSWFADGARVILKGTPGSGKTTLIETSTMLFASEFSRYKDALFYYENSMTKDDMPCPCGKYGKKFRECCKEAEWTYYRIRDKVITSFGAREYLNMYRKEWATCPKCYKPATHFVDVATEDGAMVHYFRCDNIYDCPGTKDAFVPEVANNVESVADRVEPREDPSKWGFDVNVKYGNRGLFCANDKNSGRRNVVIFRERTTNVRCPKCNAVVFEDIDDFRFMFESNGQSSEVKLDAEEREQVRFDFIGPVVTYKHLSCGNVWPVDLRDIFQIGDVGGVNFYLNRYTNSHGCIFSSPHFEPILGVAKITPKKRPEEIFYYTRIEKEIEDVDEPGKIRTREKFIMPPAARPIVPANVKFFNEFNRCLKPDTKVLRRDGEFVPIETLIPGDFIAGYARGYGSEWVKVEAKSLHSFEHALEIRLLGGQRLVMSPDHHCIVFEEGTFVHKKAIDVQKGDEFMQAEFSPADKKSFSEEPVIYLPVDSIKEIGVKEGYLVDIGVADLTAEGHESDHVFLAESLVLTGNSRPEVQDEVLGLLEEGEVEYKGESFYTNKPFIAFFDLNPHKEAKDVVLDWAFYDRLDLEITLPAMNFGSKLDILLERFLDVRDYVFKMLATDSCGECGCFVPRWHGWNAAHLPGHLRPNLPSCEFHGSRDPDKLIPGSTTTMELVKGVEPVFLDELDEIRKKVKAVEFTRNALKFLAILSDLYGRCYYRYVSSDPTKPHPALMAKQRETGREPGVFVDISTVQWWGQWQKKVDGINMDISQGKAMAGALGTPGDDTKRKLFMSTDGGGLQRPLGFRVCKSVEKLAQARAWFLTMSRVTKTGKPPAMTEEPVESSEIQERRQNIIQDFQRRQEPIPPKKLMQLDRMRSESWYRLGECPFCGFKVDETNLRTGERYKGGEAACHQGAGGITDGCKNCLTPFYPVFKIVVTPEDVAAVFPYCASMRFCADYMGSNVPQEVFKWYPNVVEWLKAETRQFVTVTENVEAFEKAYKSIDDAFDVCKLGSAGAAVDKWENDDIAKNLSEDYPFVSQFSEYLMMKCNPDKFSNRWPLDDKGEEWTGVKPDGTTDPMSRPKSAWDLPPDQY